MIETPTMKSMSGSSLKVNVSAKIKHFNLTWCEASSPSKYSLAVLHSTRNIVIRIEITKATI